jgi:hypothetical protein
MTQSTHSHWSETGPRRMNQLGEADLLWRLENRLIHHRLWQRSLLPVASGLSQSERSSLLSVSRNERGRLQPQERRPRRESALTGTCSAMVPNRGATMAPFKKHVGVRGNKHAR